jgi:hypothetical protein
MSFWANVFCADVFWENVVLGKCLWANVVWANVGSPIPPKGVLHQCADMVL